MKKTHSIKVGEAKADRIFNKVNTIFLILLLLIIFYPIYFVIIASISDANLVNAGKVLLWPKGITIAGYKKVLANAAVLRGAKNTVIYTALGTTLSVFLTMMGAYAMTVKFPGRKYIMGMMIFTMFFSGGLIPTYFLIRSLNLLDTMWAMILPGAISIYNLIIARTFIKTTIPKELFESAQIDGCSRTRFLLSIVFPLSGALVAILALYYGVGHWNSYFAAIVYLTDRSLYPLQLVMREILILNKLASSDMMSISDTEGTASLQQVADSMKYALIIITSLPVMLAYPFVQKYFVKGIMIGSVKG